MTALALRDFYLTPEEYLAGEEASPQKHEYLNGVVHAMAGGTPDHSSLAVRIGGLLDAHLRGKPCRPYNSDMRLRIERASDRRFYYPDAMVVCNPRRAGSWQDEPVVVVEVLSASTARTAHGEKREACLQIPSLRHYVMVDSEKIETFGWHLRDGVWRAEILRNPEDVIRLEAVACEIGLREIYEDVLLPARTG